ncbi:MAG: bifunctional UDP-N-acetylglucosamine diphosphorylase/glucosamine-1-phosphate N-acetyltransferase GlmU [Endomicrobiales bacterium]
MKNLAVVILAAGEGTRMKSGKPKVLHDLAGRPLVRWVLSSVSALSPEKVCLVVGHKADTVREELSGEKLGFVVQEQQLGSGHALRQAESCLKGFRGDILVLCGDTPLISRGTLRSLVASHRREKNDVTILSAAFENPYGYGRIVRRPSGQVQAIVEEKDATPEQRRIKEINSGIYCFRSPLVWDALRKIRANNRKKEYYLTDAIAIVKAQGGRIGAVSGAVPHEILGVNTRLDLARAEEIVRGRVLEKLMLGGVTITDPRTTYVSADARVGRDTVIYPGTILEGACTVGEGCFLGPASFLRNAHIGNGVEIRSSFVYDSRVSDGVKIGPFSHLRPGSIVEPGARIGNFSEVKNSRIKTGAKVNHLSYIGDSLIGRNANIGAGTITCNFDGVRKNRTIIGDRAFVGSNVNLVAPVTIGADAVLGAGSTITDDVPARGLAIARARQLNKQRKK